MSEKGMTYAGSGVDIDAGEKMVAGIRRHVARTYGPRVIDMPGGFAGLLRLDYNEKLFKKNYRDPVLVSCTDGVGSKVKLAIELGLCDTVGIDCVAMNVNDMLVMGAEPLLFLDYIGTHKLEPGRMAELVRGVADGCYEAGCALLGGETAELPDLYAPGDFDLAGFAVGVCELRRIIDGRRQLRAGDAILGLASSGVHSNGYSLVRGILRERRLKLDRVYPEIEDDRPLGRVLLTPTRLYVRSILRVLKRYKVKRVVRAMAHVTGGGIAGNLGRVLPGHLDAHIRRSAWSVPPVFRFLQEKGRIETAEMDRVFNQGIGFCLAVRPAFADSIADRLRREGETVYRLGTVRPGTGKVRLT